MPGGNLLVYNMTDIRRHNFVRVKKRRRNGGNCWYSPGTRKTLYTGCVLIYGLTFESESRRKILHVDMCALSLSRILKELAYSHCITMIWGWIGENWGNMHGNVCMYIRLCNLCYCINCMSIIYSGRNRYQFVCKVAYDRKNEYEVYELYEGSLLLLLLFWRERGKVEQNFRDEHGYEAGISRERLVRISLAEVGGREIQKCLLFCLYCIVDMWKCREIIRRGVSDTKGLRGWGLVVMFLLRRVV